MNQYSNQIHSGLWTTVDRLWANAKPKLNGYSISVFVLILTSCLLIFPSAAISDCTWLSLIGDANGDEQITPGDALEIFWASINGDWQAMENFCCFDANRDETVTPADALMVFWYSIYGRSVEGVTGYVGERCMINTAPIASFTVNPISGTTSTTFIVDASGSSDNEDPISALQARWDWDNDGLYDTGWLTTKTASHQYASANIYTIRLEVQDTGGLTDTDMQEVTVIPPGCGTVSDIDGNTYQTVQIGDQCWMAENLKVTRYRNGDPIPHITDNSEWENITTGAYCNYNNDPGNVATYGRLYNWYAVDDSRSIAPAGWHVPSDEEWKQLEMYLGMSQSETDGTGDRGTDEGGKMKEAGTSHWYSPNTGATNSSGFSALPGAYRYYDGSFYPMGYFAFFWTSTEYYSDRAWYRVLRYGNAKVNRGEAYKRSGFSVRCVRD